MVTLSKTLQQIFVYLGLAAGLIGCGGSNGGSEDNPEPPPAPSTRSFYMGFTPWPYDATVSAITETYTRIQDSGDIVAHHLMDGIPWEEAYSETAFPMNIENEISSRINGTETDKVIYLALDSLNGARDGLALNWGSGNNEALPAPWDGYNFDDQEVIDAYSSFALEMIERFDPEYFSYASEISELALNDATKFAEFATFSEAVYNNIKAVYPNLPIMVSIALKSPSSDEATTIASSFTQISDFVDIVGISVYPYAFFAHSDKGDPANLPDSWLTQVSAIAGDKPVAITETGWIAEDLEISNFGFSEESDVTKQNAYVEALFSEADDLSAEFIIWFSIVDYDALWEGILGQDDISKIWKDTGLYNEMLNARPALTTWDDYYSRNID